jgi:segregation and condensation protein B
MSGLFDEFDMPGHDALAQAVAELQHDGAERGIELVEVASGFRYQVCRDVHPFVSRLWAERPSRYSRALLETLSLIAYRQPITRAEIEQIRGVAVSTNIVRTLEEREWVRVVGYRDLPGKPALFGTTKQFLDYFNLKSLDQLPPLADIRDLEDFDPQLSLGADPVLIAAVPDHAADDSDVESDDGAPAHFTDEFTADKLADVDALPAPDDSADDAPADPSSPSAEPASGAPSKSTTEPVA